MVYNKVTKFWTEEMDYNVRASLGDKFSRFISLMTDQQFSKTVSDMLILIHPSRLELECIQLAAESGNRLRVFHNTLVAFFASVDVIKETQGQGIDQEDVEQHGLYDISSHLTLIHEVSSEGGITYGCPCLDDMDYQDLVHTYSR